MDITNHSTLVKMLRLLMINFEKASECPCATCWSEGHYRCAALLFVGPALKLLFFLIDLVEHT